MAVEQITDQTFEDKAINAGDTPVLVDFWAEWCGPCKMLAPVLDAISDKLAGKISMYKLNTDDNMETAQKYQIASIPCCIIFKNGEEVHRIIGHKSQDALETEIQNYL